VCMNSYRFGRNVGRTHLKHLNRIACKSHYNARSRHAAAAAAAAVDATKKKWWQKTYYGQAYQHRMQLAWGASVFILFCGMPMIIHMNQEEKRSKLEKQKNPSTFIKNITVNPRVMTEEEKIKTAVLGMGGTREQMELINDRAKKLDKK
jgi:hypothetical protein